MLSVPTLKIKEAFKQWIKLSQDKYHDKTRQFGLWFHWPGNQEYLKKRTQKKTVGRKKPQKTIHCFFHFLTAAVHGSATFLSSVCTKSYWNSTLLLSYIFNWGVQHHNCTSHFTHLHFAVLSCPDGLRGFYLKQTFQIQICDLRGPGIQRLSDRHQPLRSSRPSDPKTHRPRVLLVSHPRGQKMPIWNYLIYIDDDDIVRRPSPNQVDHFPHVFIVDLCQKDGFLSAPARQSHDLDPNFCFYKLDTNHHLQTLQVGNDWQISFKHEIL